MGPFAALLMALSDVYAAEGRPGGDRIAEAYARAAETMAEPPLATPYLRDADIRAAYGDGDHPAARAAKAAHGLLPWTATGIPDALIPDDVSDMFAVAALLGPGALVEVPDLRGGLFMQRAGLFYPLHAHNAEETYAMLAGEGEWTLEGHAPVLHGAGALIHHPSNAGHATRTRARPLLAAWRWSGDIDTTSYRML